jgi:hypothetical protein
MKVTITLFAVIMAIAAYPGVGAAQDVDLIVKGSAWDSDSRGFASIGGLSVSQGTQKAARRGARISLDGHPEVFAISGEGGEFELAFSTTQETFRLILEGDRFPRTITQPFTIPEDEEVFDVGRINSPRAEGGEHTWPLPLVAAALGYGSTHEMLADNKAAIRLLTYGSGADGAPKWAAPVTYTFPESMGAPTGPEPTTTSPFLMRIPQPEYVINFDMNTQDTYFLPIDGNTGSSIIIVAFNPGEGVDKDIVLQVTDTVSDELLDPPRPWKFSPKTISVRNGFATELRLEPDIDQ